jgi:predicted esterase
VIARLAAETPGNEFEAAALPLYQALWRQLEQDEGLSRDHVVAATVFRTGTATRTIELAKRVLRRRPRPDTTPLLESATTARCRLVRGDLLLPQFQTGTPPFLTVPGTGAFALDADGVPVVQREEPVGVTLCVPQEPADGSLPMPRRGWPIVLYMHGTGGSRQSFVNEGIADELAALGIASLSFDQPMHGPRPGVGEDFYNPLNPLSFRDNSRQSAVEGLLLDDLMGRLRFEPSAFTLPPGAGFVAPTRRVTFDRRRRAFFGHSQGATVGPLFLPFAKGLRGGVLSAGGGHLLLNILTRDTPLIAGQTAKTLVELLLGAPIDEFHPALHLLQMGGEPSDPLAYVDRFAVNRRGRALSILFTHGMLDPDVPTTLTASMVVAARYPLVAPTYPNRVFPSLPSYDYREAVSLAGIPTLTTPVSGNLRGATGGLVMFELDGHFPAFDNPDARAQWRGFIDSLLHERLATIPPRP